MRPVENISVTWGDNIKISLGEMSKYVFTSNILWQYTAGTRLPDTYGNNRKTLNNIQ